MDFQMPRPGPQHDLLARMVGRFAGEEALLPSAWCPEEQRRTSTITARMLDGFFVISDYEQRDGDQITFRGHGVYSWDPHVSRYRMYWFDSMGGPGGIADGIFEDGALTFENASPMGQHRYRYTFDDHGYAFEMALKPAGGGWAAQMKAVYRPAG